MKFSCKVLYMFKIMRYVSDVEYKYKLVWILKNKIFYLIFIEVIICVMKWYLEFLLKYYRKDKSEIKKLEIIKVNVYMK